MKNEMKHFERDQGPSASDCSPVADAGIHRI